MSTIRDQILGRATATPNLVPIGHGAWPDLYVRTMTAADRDAWEGEQYTAAKAGNGFNNVRAKLVARTVVDGEGKRVFVDADAVTLGQLPADEIRHVFDIAARVNALTPDDAKELEKNS
jgi:hypothetical protein